MKTRLALLILGALSFFGCNTQPDAAEKTRLMELHTPLTVESVSSMGASSVTIGTIYLEAQLQPLKVDNVFLQASDVAVKDGNFYISYSSVDVGNIPVKKGAIEHVQAYPCPLNLLYSAYCLKVVSELSFSHADMFSASSDGSNLYAVGSTSDESTAPNFARLYKIPLSGANKTMTRVTESLTLPSYAGTGVLPLTAGTLIATSGTSIDAAKMGGVSFINSNTMSILFTAPLYDARDAAWKSGKVYVTRGKIDASNAGAVVEYNANDHVALRTINTGGNTIPESKSSIEAGNELLLVSMGDQGFKVVCRATGVTLLTKAAVTVSGIPASRTVTNSVVAAPGYIFAANGEAGLYVYKFEKTSLLNSNYCQGVKATLLGRLSMDSDDSDSTYINGEISANSVRYVNGGLLGLTTKLLVIASGNKGISMVNISGLSVGLSDVNDF